MGPTGDAAGSSSHPIRATHSAPPQHLICPITFELMKDPVMDCFGDTYERRAFQLALLVGVSGGKLGV